MMTLVRSVSLLVVVLVLFLASSEGLSAEAGEFPAGSYQTGQYTITFKEGAFHVTVASGAGVKGSYKVSGEQIEFTDQEGEFVCPGPVGTYNWKVDGEKLILNLVADNCDGRAQALTSGPLTPKKAQ